MTARSLVFGALATAVVILSPWVVLAQDDGEGLDPEIRERNEKFVYILGQGESGRLEILVEEGDGVNYVLSSGDRTIEFHVFSVGEEGDRTEFVGPKRTREESGVLVAPVGGVYVFMTERRGELDATVRLTLEGRFGIMAKEGMDPAQDVPGLGAGVLLLVVLTIAALSRKDMRRRPWH